MKALLIGGTGTISLAVSRLLLEKGWDLYLLNRGNSPLPQGAHSLVADIHDEDAVAKLARGMQFDVVADFIAYTPADIERDYRLFAGKTGQYIFISSASAYKKPGGSLPITESTPLANPFWQYSRDKIACEEALMRLHRESGFPVTIVRPSHTYSEKKVPVGPHGGRSWPVLQRILDEKPVLIHGDGTSLWTFTHARDFAKGFVGLMANPHALGEAVHITSDETLCWNDAYRTIAGILGKPLHPLYVPSETLATAGRAFGYDYKGSLLGDKANSAVFDNTKLKRLVPGFCATTRFDEGAREAIANMMKEAACQKTDEKYDAFCDKLAAAMADVSKIQP